VFDRMFSLGVRGSGTDTAPVSTTGGRITTTAGPRRHFLYCSLKEPSREKTKRSMSAANALAGVRDAAS
jgi:hypothetical protein